MDELGVAVNAAFDPKDVADAVHEARGSVSKRTTIEEARNALQGGPYLDPVNRFEIQIYDGTEALKFRSRGNGRGGLASPFLVHSRLDESTRRCLSPRGRDRRPIGRRSRDGSLNPGYPTSPPGRVVEHLERTPPREVGVPGRPIFSRVACRRS